MDKESIMDSLWRLDGLVLIGKLLVFHHGRLFTFLSLSFGHDRIYFSLSLCFDGC